MKVINIFKHLHTVNKHRFLVFKLSIKAGIPLQGLVHDLSKYSLTEFIEGVKYYQGNYSPIRNCKRDKGYSLAWLHHKGRNKHHYEYWYDYSLTKPEVLIPYKYFAEMVCDSLAAGMTYEGKSWTKEFQLGYWNKARKGARIDERIDKALTRIYSEVAEKGIDEVITSKNLKKVYNESLEEEVL